MSAPELPDIDNLDYFQLFGVERDAGVDEVRTAFHNIARRFHPDLYVQKSTKERLAAARVYRRATEAYRVLLDPQRRRVYMLELEQGRLRLAPSASLPPRPMHRAGSINPLAAKHINEARIAMQRGDYATASRQLKSAKIFDPKNEELLALMKEVEQKLVP